MTEFPTPGLTRHFVTLGDRQVQYRRAGKGPPLVMLHRLPRSSKDLVPAMLLHANRFTVIAPDLAGYGNSSLLPTPAPTIPDYAADVAAFIAALGIARCVLYGEGQGALVALSLASQRADLVAALATRDVPAPASGAAVDDALIPFVPTWDGRHLAWLWAYLREENVFAPPWEKSLAHRIDAAMPSPADLQSRAVQLLTGAGHGRSYHLGLRAALAFEAPAVAVPSVDLATYTSDLPSPPPPPRVKPIPGALWSDFVSLPSGQLHFHMNGDAQTVPLLVQHDAASSVGTVEPITRSFLGKRTVMAFDMPGSGESDRMFGDTVDVMAYADVLGAALDKLGLAQVDFYGMWGGGFVGLDLATARPHLVRRLVMSNLFQHEGAEQRAFQTRYTPDVSPVWHGGHLLQCWHQMRDQGIYYPWFASNPSGIIRREPYLDTDMVHERVCSLMKAGNGYRTAYQAHFRYPTHARLKASPVPTLVATTVRDPNYSTTQEAAKAAPNAELRLFDAAFTKWGEGFLDFLA